MKEIKIGSDFSGVGAFNMALQRLNIPYQEVFACDMDKYARQTFIENHGEPKYFPWDVYERAIPTDPLDIYMTSPPCQAFSLAGRRKGEDDKRGILFYNSHEFIKRNKPRFFIFENVKGLLSDDKGNTFAKWVQYLGGKSVNGVPVLFPHEEATPYHLYWRVLNAKHYNIPQNRERVFIVGIRDDQDNHFNWPIEVPLKKKLKNVLESKVDEKYYLSETIIKGFLDQDNNFNGKFEPKDVEEELANCITSSCAKMARTDNYIKVKSGNIQGFELAKIGEDSINYKQSSSETRRGRVGKNISQSIETNPCIGVAIGSIVGRPIHNPKCRESGHPTKQMLEVNQFETSNDLTTVQKDNVVVYFNLSGGKWDKTHEQSRRVYSVEGISPAIHTMSGGDQHHKIYYGYRIRRLTPLECFRLMDFPDSFKWSVSDTQAYKQAGNSICVGVLGGIIKNLKHLIK